MFDDKELAIEIEDLSFIYPDGTEALKGVSLKVRQGESLAIIGPNGAGKSTLLLNLNGLLRGNGLIKIFGIKINSSNLKNIRKKVGLVFQNPDDQLFCSTVYEDVAFGPTNLGLSKEEVKGRVKDALFKVEMVGYENSNAFHLSYGQKKRVAIATILSMNPDIVAIDEPSSNLDHNSQIRLAKILNSLSKTKLIVTHDIPYAALLCDRAVILDNGKIVADGLFFDILSKSELLGNHRLGLPPGFSIKKLKEDKEKSFY
jgi:cobalt/nickel transport system ATP-binding protein